MYTTTVLLALGLAAQGAVAGGAWGAAKPFSCPGNTPTTCSSDQSSGFTWGSAQVGQQVSSYGGCGFQNTKCEAQGPGGKLHKRTGAGSDKCVTGPIHGSASSCPKISAGKGSGAGETFSPDSYHVSCSYDTQVDFTYEMQDGSTCKHTSPCSAGGNTVQNTQCGGAKSVTCSQSDSEKKKNNGKECSLGFHSVGFKCGPATTVVPPKSSTPPATKPATSPVQSHPATTTPETKPATSPETKPATSPETKPATSSSTKVGTTSTELKPSTTPVQSKPVTSTTPVASSRPFTVPANSSTPVESKPATSAPGTTIPASSLVTTTFMTASTVFQTTEITVTSCAPEITNCPAESKTPMVITKTLSQFTTICPVTATMVPSGSTMVPVISSKPVESSAAPSSAPAETTPVATSKAPESSAPASQPSGVPLNCPEVVPSCINTLLQSVQTECQNNADSACFCSVANHTQFIQECITAHGSDESTINNALGYLQGICAPQIPQNPTIVTHQPAGQPQAPQCPSGIPATTITVHFTTTVPCSQTNAPVSTPAPSAPAANTTPAAANTTPAPAAPPAPSMTVITTQSVVTVPQVQVTQPPAAPGASTQPPAALVPGVGTSTAPAATQGPPATQPAANSAPAATQPAVNVPGAPVYGGVAKSSAAAASTGGVSVPTGPISPPIATGAAGKMGVSFGAVAVAAALLI